MIYEFRFGTKVGLRLQGLYTTTQMAVNRLPRHINPQMYLHIPYTTTMPTDPKRNAVKQTETEDNYTDEEKLEILANLAANLTANTQDIPPEFATVLSENFWDLI
jgi:hypothetical protein